MKKMTTLLSVLSICLTSIANAGSYSQTMTCKTIKGPELVYQKNGGTFKIESVTDASADPVFMVLGVWAPHSAHKAYISSENGGLKSVILAEPKAVFLKEPTYIKVDGEYHVTSAQFKITSKMRSDFTGEVASLVADSGIGDLSVEKINQIKQNINSVLNKAIVEQTIDSEVICEMAGSLK